VKESERVPDVLTGLKKIDELDPKRGSNLDFEQRLGDDSGSSEVGFDWKWPPWKNIPLRYKLIGTTSLAFVICNMDKVSSGIFGLISYVHMPWCFSVSFKLRIVIF